MWSLHWQITVVVSLAPRQIDRGDVQWHYWEDTEAGKYRSWSCWKKRTVSALSFLFSIAHSLVKVKYIYYLIHHLKRENLTLSPKMKSVREGKRQEAERGGNTPFHDFPSVPLVIVSRSWVCLMRRHDEGDGETLPPQMTE